MATHRDGDRDGVTLIVVIVIIVLLSADLPLQNVLDPLLQLRRVRKVVLIRHRQPDAVSLGRGGERGATIVWGCGEVGMRKYGDVGTRDGRWGHGMGGGDTGWGWGRPRVTHICDIDHSDLGPGEVDAEGFLPEGDELWGGHG